VETKEKHRRSRKEYKEHRKKDEMCNVIENEVNKMGVIQSEETSEVSTEIIE